MDTKQTLCRDCSSCKIDLSVDGDLYEARCLKAGKRKPKMITWAADTILESVPETNLYRKKSGIEIVNKALSRKLAPPTWCPLKTTLADKIKHK